MVYCCRYYAVVHPMKAQYLCTTSQAKKVTILVWLLAVILSLPTAFVYVSIYKYCQIDIIDISNIYIPDIVCCFTTLLF